MHMYIIYTYMHIHAHVKTHAHTFGDHRISVASQASRRHFDSWLGGLSVHPKGCRMSTQLHGNTAGYHGIL